jgi:energy-coupling factor transporter ATP-binding protein EcfA2
MRATRAVVRLGRPKNPLTSVRLAISCSHRPHARDRNGPPHEKTDPTIAKTVECALQPNIRDEEQALLHLKDEDTSWFGAGRDELDDAVFQDYGRYANLMAERSARHRTLRYPALVSFVGQTGAGKSTLIRLLIELLSLDIQNPQVPVVGSVHNPDIPTSGDVHLYCDPRSSGSEHPILYADCEGLDGGAREPLGAKSRRKNRREGSGNEQKKRTTSFTKHIRRTHNTSEREILWATTEATRSREFYVRNLYPRLLYTFSDVIVFVTKNPKVIENVIEHLIRWSAAALETSSNQPVLPHAIIVLNAADHGTDQNLWDVDKSTVALLDSVGRAVHQNHNFRKHAEFWRQKQKSIESIESLLSLYYSSIRVVRVPAKGRPKLISEQLHRLYNEISGAADRARASKHTLRMLLDSDELQPYLQYAFDHFCRDLDVPFDFVQASFAHNPIPSDFGGNILKLAININEVWRDKVDGPTIFKELSFIVASCIMLEQARHRTLGSAEQVFPEYLDHCDVALEDFCQRYWPCEYVGGRGRCVNVKAGHIKGHQLKSGQVLAVGNYCSSFSAESYRPTFRNNIYRMLAKLLEKLQNATQTTKYMETQEAANIHRDTVLRHFFHHLDGPKNFISHTACFSCLIAPPEHPLPCGHVLCTSCIRDFGSARGRTTIDMKYCPLHRKEDPDGQFDGRWPVIVKPPGAGIRVLSLDGGGIRGIVELITLQHIQTELGVRLPIQAFFDLIVGTSTVSVPSIG